MKYTHVYIKLRRGIKITDDPRTLRTLEFTDRYGDIKP